MSEGVNRPTPKLTMNYGKLRSFSESPIPRRAIDYIKNQVAMLEGGVVPIDGSAPNARQKADAQRVMNILAAPNDTDSYRTFIEQLLEDKLVIGHGVAEKREWPTNKNRPLVLYPFDASSLEIYTDWDGRPDSPRFAQTGINGHQFRTFAAKDVMYIPHNPRTSTPWGLAPLEVAAQSIEYLLNTQSYAGRMTSQARPGDLLDLGDLDQEQVKEFRMYWRDEIEGRGRMPIIGSGSAKSINLGATSDEALFLKWQSFLIIQIANAFGLDAQKFSATLATKSNGDVMDNASDEGAVRPLADSIQDVINRDIVRALDITDMEFRFRWTTNFQDRKALAAVHQIYLTQDTMMIDEARSELGLPPLPDGKGQYTLAEYRAIYGAIPGTRFLPGGTSEDEQNSGLPMGWSPDAQPTPDANANPNPAQTQGQSQTKSIDNAPKRNP